MKYWVSIFAAAMAVEVFAGFAENLDTSGLLDVPAECKKLNNIVCGGSKDGTTWVPLDVSFDANGKASFSGDNYTRMQTLDSYITFGTYDDQSSIESFFSRGVFTNTRGELKYTTESIMNVYTAMETENFEKFGEIVEQVQQNVAEYCERDKRQNGGTMSSAGIAAMGGWTKFVNSFAVAKAAHGAKTAMLTYFSNKLNSATTEAERSKWLDAFNSAITSVGNYGKLDIRLLNVETEYNKMVRQYGNDVNQIAAYLGSTNAMEFFSALVGDDWIFDPVKRDRWCKFSEPEELKGNPSAYEYFNVGGFDWYTILHNLQSQYFIQAKPANADSVLLDHFNMPGMAEANFRGLYELPDDNLVTTNWYANKITAPVNWADGSTLIVTNGKFKVASAAPTAWVWEGGSIRNGRIQVGTEIVNANNGAPYATSAAGDYYAHLFIPEAGTRTITINQSATGGDFAFKVCTVTGTGTNQVCTFQLAAMPVICVYE